MSFHVFLAHLLLCHFIVFFQFAVANWNSERSLQPARNPLLHKLVVTLCGF